MHCSYVVIYTLQAKGHPCVFLDTVKEHHVLTQNTKFAQQGFKLTSLFLSLALSWAVQTVPNSAPNCQALKD